jgi:hypothetical protein
VPGTTSHAAGRGRRQIPLTVPVKRVLRRYAADHAGRTVDSPGSGCLPDGAGERGVVAGGAVGTKAVGRLRIFRYEIRRWRDGVIPDLGFAVASPLRISEDPALARRILRLLPSTPTPTWGRDELGAGEMWTCNSIISWVLTRAGVDPGVIAFPPRARAPGWDAGVIVARRQLPSAHLGTAA